MILNYKLNLLIVEFYLFQASDGVFSSQATVNVQVLDVNNNQPEFTLKFYNMTVSENLKIGIKID